MLSVWFLLSQLQDTLMQRDEELARLHEENNKLKDFLNSSFVKCLEDKRKVIRCYTVHGLVISSY